MLYKVRMAERERRRRRRRGRREGGREGKRLERGGEKEIIAEHAGPVLIMRFS